MNPSNDLPALESDLAPQRGKLADLVAQAAWMSVTTPDEEEAAIDAVKEGKAIAARIKGIRDYITKPLKAQVKLIEAPFNLAIKMADEIEETLKPKMTAFYLERTAAARKAAEEADTKRREAEAVQAATGSPFTEVGPDDDEVIEEPAQTSRTWSGAKSTYIEKKKGRVIDFALLPDEYKLPDESKINRAVADGIIIPGIEVYTEVTSRIS